MVVIQLKELIEKKVLSRNWTFNEISDLRNTISVICNDIYSEMSLIEKFKIIDEFRIKEDYVGKYFNDVMKEMVVQLDSVGKRLGATTGMGNQFQGQIMSSVKSPRERRGSVVRAPCVATTSW